MELRWVQGTDMLAYILTKRGVNPNALLDVVTKGKLPPEKKNEWHEDEGMGSGEWGSDR